MPVTALVVTLRDATSSRALDRLKSDPRIDLGPLQGTRLPVVVETKTAREGRSIAEEFEELSDVTRVDLISVNFEDLQG